MLLPWRAPVPRYRPTIRTDSETMSILHPISEFAPGKNRSTRPRSINANDAVLRAIAVVSLLAVGAIHFLQIIPTTEQTPWLGVSFLFLIAGCLAVAARVATHSDQRTWIASGMVCVAAIGGYAFTRTFSTPWTTRTPVTGRACSAWPPCSSRPPC
jgi:hypothetical protein